jgi:LysM repeat protein
MKSGLRLVLIALMLLAFGFAGLAATQVSADSPLYHVVSWGDTLFSIATKYNTSVNAILQANGLRNADFIYVGQRLSIPGSSVPAPSNGGTYVVQNGDTLFSIATRNGVTVNALMQANRLYNYWIYVGQTLRMPGDSPNPMPNPIPNPPGPMPNPNGTHYIVRPGDYLAGIAYRFGVSAYSIQIANRLSNPNFVWVGQRLFIPGGMPLLNQPPSYQPPFFQSIQPIQPNYPGQPVQPSYPNYPPYFPPMATPAPVVINPVPIPNPNSSVWEAVVITNTVGNGGACSLAVIVVGKENWPVVVATTDGSTVTDPKLTGTKPERGPYVVEFAHACVGTWRVIPLGLNVYADITLHGGHAEVEFHPR